MAGTPGQYGMAGPDMARPQPGMMQAPFAPMQGQPGMNAARMHNAPPAGHSQAMGGVPYQPNAMGPGPHQGMPGHPGQMPGHAGQMMGPPGQMPGPGMAGPPGQMAGPPGQMAGPPGQMTGPPGQMTGPPGQMTGPPGQMTGPPGQMAGPGSAHHQMPMANQPGQMAGPPGGPGRPGQMTGNPGQMAGPPSGHGRPGQMAGPPGGPGQQGQMAGPSGHPGQMAGPPGHPGQMAGPPGGPGQPGLMAGPSGQPGQMAGPPGHPGQMAGPPGHPGQMAGPLGGPGQPGQMASPPGQPGQMAGPPGHPGQMAGPPGGPGYPGQMPGQPGQMQGQPGQMQGHPGQMQGQPGQMQGQPGQMAGPGGAQPQQPQQRLSPESTPHPLAVWQADADLYSGKTFYTNQTSVSPPLPITSCNIVDQGNCSSRFVRSTLYNVPNTQETLHQSNIPLGLCVQPLAKVPERENTLFVVNNGETGPVRCRRCKGYINPHASFVDGGRKFVCNLCNFANDVPDNYQCQLDQHGRRLDVNERPELSYGSIEFLATADYCKDNKWPEPPAYIFLIEATYQSISCGLLNLLSRMLRLVLDELPKDNGEEKSKVRIGIATFDKNVHFFNLKATLAQPQMMIVSDVADVFVPLLDGFLVDVEESSALIEAVLQELPTLYGETRETTSCLGPAVQAGLEALKAAGCPGKLFVFSSSMPKADIPGSLKNREDRALFRTDKEKNLYTPQNQFYPQLAAECVKHGACVEMFCCSTSSYVDIPTMSSLVTPTGGEIHFYPSFTMQSEGERMLKDLAHSVNRQTGFDAVMRVRCSTGLRATDFWGNLHMTNTTDVLLGGIDCDKAITVEVKYDDKLGEEGSNAYYQVALLYTSVGGQRRLRVHNLAVTCTKQLPEVYRCADMDTIMNMFLKKAVRKLSDTPYKGIRGHLLEQSIALLTCYRKECSEPASGARLILPEALKLLPLYVCSLIKSEAICAQSDTRIDDKAWLMQQVLSMPVYSSVPYLYPTVLPVHTAKPDENTLPAPTRCYYDMLTQDGIYVLENGFVLILWLGRHTHPAWVKDVFGVHSLAEIDTEKFIKLPLIDNATSARLRGIISKLMARRTRCMKVLVVLQGSQRENLLRRHLCEDSSGDGGPSYMDLLCHMHKEIRGNLS